MGIGITPGAAGNVCTCPARGPFVNLHVSDMPGGRLVGAVVEGGLVADGPLDGVVSATANPLLPAPSVHGEPTAIGVTPGKPAKLCVCPSRGPFVNRQVVDTPAGPPGGRPLVVGEGPIATPKLPCPSVQGEPIGAAVAPGTALKFWVCPVRGPLVNWHVNDIPGGVLAVGGLGDGVLLTATPKLPCPSVHGEPIGIGVAPGTPVKFCVWPARAPLVNWQVNDIPGGNDWACALCSG